MIIAFEGLDRAGKSEARRRYAKMCEERHLTIDRFTTTSWVFNRWYHRNNKEQEADLRAFENALIPKHLVVVFIDTPPEICHSRVPSNEAGYSLRQLTEHRVLFIKELFRLAARGAKVIVVDGTYPKKLLAWSIAHKITEIERGLCRSL